MYSLSLARARTRTRTLYLSLSLSLSHLVTNYTDFNLLAISRQFH